MGKKIDKETDNINLIVEMVQGENINLTINVPKMMTIFKQEIINLQEETDGYPSVFIQDLINAGNLDESILQYIDSEINYVFDGLYKILYEDKEDWRPSNYEDEKKIIYKLINEAVGPDMEDTIVIHAADHMFRDFLKN